MKSVILSAFLRGGVLVAASASFSFKVAEPYTHENLSIFLIHSTSQAGANHYVTLKKAMERKSVVVFETKNVNSLAIENVGSEAVFIQGGEIVKGGQQDRVISNDFVLPPRSGRLPISSFCVEQGRWTQRGSESVQSFSASTAMVPSKELREAVIVDHDQQKVWREVDKEQAGLASRADRFQRTDGRGLGAGAAGGTANAEVRSFVSPSSLQLTLESRPITVQTDAYIKALMPLVEGKKDIIGFAFSVNGELQSADVYSSSDLFLDLWPKLLKSSAVEAARLRKDGPIDAADASAVETLLRAADDETPSITRLPNKVKLLRRETSAQVVVESREGDRWVHRTYLKKPQIGTANHRDE